MTAQTAGEFAEYFKRLSGVDRVVVIERPGSSGVTLRLEIDIVEHGGKFAPLLDEMKQQGKTLGEALQRLQVDTDAMQALRTLRSYLKR